MKFLPMALVLLTGALLPADLSAQDDPDPVKLLTDITMANKDKDPTLIGALLESAQKLGRTSKDTKQLDPIAAQLVVSYKVCKGNWGTQRKILDTFGIMRSKKSLSLLKKVAFKKEPGNDDELTLQIRALAAIGAYAQPKYIDSIAEQTKQRNQKLAEAAYLSFSNYGIAKGKVRKKVAEALMKRLESEYPSASADKNPGEAAKKRWAALQMPIVRAMQAVCHEPTINDIANWREWWKENKKNAKAWKDPKPPKPA